MSSHLKQEEPNPVSPLDDEESDTDTDTTNLSSQLVQQDPRAGSYLDPEGELTKMISSGRFTGQESSWLMSNSTNIIKWFKRHDVGKILLAAGITFGSVLALIMGLGFGFGGIGAGTIATGIQSVYYAGLTPAGGLFATMQSLGMTGGLLPVAAGVAGGAAALVSGLFFWFRSGGHQEREEHQHEE